MEPGGTSITSGASAAVSDWDSDFPPLTDEDLASIDAALLAATSSKKRDPSHSPPKIRRRLPDSLFSLSSCTTKRRLDTPASHFQSIKFGGRILYSRTVDEVERAAQELLSFVEAKKRKEGHCILGLDIEWKPTFTRGVAPSKAAVMQICGDINRCYVLHIKYSGIPKTLQCLLEDPSSLKVGVGIAGDASKVSLDYGVSIKNLEDLSYLANKKLGLEPKNWGLSSLTETLISKKLPKPNKIRLGNWEVNPLSKQQLNYAAADAYVSWYLHQVLMTLPDCDDTKSVETAVPS